MWAIAGMMRNKKGEIGMRIQLPQNVSFILDTFLKNSFSAFIVGGCVRDALLKKNPTDWDICTNALPEETIKIFKSYKIIETGIKHGTITLIIDSVPYEITTFRTDGDYIDNRHPQSVNFVRNIEEDLARRDFTINAMAYNETDGLIDLYGGQRDLGNKIIRCVGDAGKRFSEDALRIMRAIRFSAVLDFTIEEKTKNAIFSLKNNLSNIATERINVEFSKILLSDNKNVYCEYYEIFKLFINISPELDAANLVKLPNDLETRLSYLLLSSGLGAEVLENLRYPSKTIKAVSEVIKNFDSKYESIKDLRLLISNSSYETAHRILTIKMCKKDAFNLLLKAKNMPCKIQDLKICGNDLIESGIKDGLLIGKLLKELLYLVIDEKCENEKFVLINKVKELMEEWK